ncbi:MAG: prolyl oligopeptidase family serine peptidase [Zavarzinella sp.]
MRCILLMTSILFVFATSVGAQTHTIVPEDYFSLRLATEVALSPDGKYIAYSLASWDENQNTRKSDLWVVSTDKRLSERLSKRLTFDQAGERHLQWSSDSQSIYCLANRKRGGDAEPYNGTTQVWQVGITGNQIHPITRKRGGLADYAYDPVTETVYYQLNDTTRDQDEFAHLRKKYTSVEYGHGVRTTSTIHQLSLKNWREQKIIDDQRFIREFSVAPGGERIAMITAFDDTVIRSEGGSRVDVWSKTTGNIVTPPTACYREKAASPHAWLQTLAWSPDGTKFAFCAVFDAYPAEIVIGSIADSQWSTGLMPRPDEIHVQGYGSPIQWFDDDHLLFCLEKEGTVTPVLSAGSSIIPIVSAELKNNVVYGVHASAKTKQLTMILSTNTAFADIFVSDIAKKALPTKLTDINPQTSDWKLPKVSHIRWNAVDGSKPGGILELPYGWDGKTKLPLVVAIHGGPTTATKVDVLLDPHNARGYFTAAGYAVLCPNYRGSTGYGDKYLTDLVGRENDVEVKDIIAGIQHLIKEGIVDPNRIGVAGWSNGGYLTNCLITLKDSPIKFKAASSGAGIMDTCAEWGFNDEPAYPRVFKKGHPWEQPDLYRKTSPVFDLANVTTPTIIHVGGNDVRCPPGHSQMLYRALKEYLHVPCEWITYTGEPHGLSKLNNRRAKMEWDLAWFDKYLKNAK